MKRSELYTLFCYSGVSSDVTPQVPSDWSKVAPSVHCPLCHLVGPVILSEMLLSLLVCVLTLKCLLPERTSIRLVHFNICKCLEQWLTHGKHSYCECIIMIQSCVTGIFLKMNHEEAGLVKCCVEMYIVCWWERSEARRPVRFINLLTFLHLFRC